ncbi:MAG: hypothetical protein ACRYGP_29570 [Janthinobacterium lividum]
MIIKSDRVATIASKRRLIDHLLHGEENDAVEVLQGGERDLLDAWRDARNHDAPKALRVWILAPREETTREQAFEILKSIASEFRFDIALATVVEHEKQRAVPGAFNRHWHMAIGEVDPVTGRVLSSSHDHARHEFIARLSEARLGHSFTLGAHTKAVLARLRREGNSAVADALDTAFAMQCAERPREAFTTAQHQAAKRGGVDLPAMREVVGTAWASSTSLAGLTVALEAAGLSLSPGDVEGEWTVTQETTLLGSLRRLTKTRKAAFAVKMKELIDADAHKPGSETDRTDDPGRDRTNAARDIDTTQVRGDAGTADEGRAGELHVGRPNPVESAGGRDGADARESAGVASSDHGARFHRRDEGGDERQLIITEMSGCVRAVSQLVLRADVVAKPAVSRVHTVLDRYTANETAALKHRPKISAPSLDAMLVEIKALQEQSDALGEESLRITDEIGRLLSAKDTRERSFWARWSRSPDFDVEIKRLKFERIQVEAKRSRAQRTLQKTTLAEASLRRAHKEAVITASAEHDRASKLSKFRLAIYDRARKLLEAWPALAHCGIQRVHAMAWRVEKLREKGWDPGSQANDLRMR